jgi:hypothetical protein
MITIHLGRQDSPMQSGVIVIRQPDDYITARHALRQALHEGDALDIYVLTRVCDEWFWDLEGFPGVVQRREDPVSLLCQLLDVTSLPSGLDDSELIQRLGLLRQPASSAAIHDVIGWALGSLLDPVWIEEEPSFAHFTRLIAWWAEHRIPQDLAVLVTQRLEAWKMKSRDSLRDAYEGLNGAPERIILFLCCWRVLQTYSDELRQRWLEEEGWYLPRWQSLVNKLGPLPMPEIAENTLSRKVETYWRGQLRLLDREVSS